MNTRPRFPYADQDEVLLTLSCWQRQSEALLLSRLYGAPEAGEEIEDAAYEAPEPYVLSPRQEAAEYHYDNDDRDDDQLRWETEASPIGLEDDAEALASAGMVEEP